ncbi:MAG: methionine aminotransferase [Bacteroidota bacterium]|jgi:methionine aminotransferase
MTHSAPESKLPAIGTTIFSVMTALANEHGALNMAQGFPDFTCHPELKRLVAHYINKDFNQYAPMPGAMKLREAIAKKTEKLYAAKYHPESEITITAGATQAIFTAITALVKRGDEVIVIEPAYDCYVPAIELNGGIPVYIQLHHPSYTIPWDELEKLINHKTRLIILNTPGNPGTSVLVEDDIAKLQAIIEKYPVFILSDEVYEHIIFDNLPHLSMARFPLLRERSIIVSSFGKTYHTTGWKLGYCLAPHYLMTEIRKVHQFNVFAVNHPIQLALADFLEHEDQYLTLGKFYEEKRNLFVKLMQGSRFTILPSTGSYFQLLGYSAITESADKEFSRKLTIENKIASIPISVFYHDQTDHHVLRFCFAKSPETLEKAASILHRI